MEDYAQYPKNWSRPKSSRPRRPSSIFSITWRDLLPLGRFRLRYLFFLVLFLFLFILAGRYYWREMRWRYIVIHHTAADIGNLEFYRKQHQKRWGDLAYHIIINNGSENTAAGQIEYSEGWRKRKHHYSTRKSYLNYFGIALALVGDFEKHPMPTVQKQIFIRLLTNLAREYNIPPERIIGHREVQNTKCPGRHVSMSEIRLLVKKNLD